jgi:hypothetical protein
MNLQAAADLNNKKFDQGLKNTAAERRRRSNFSTTKKRTKWPTTE